jgi:hypothetical protein
LRRQLRNANLLVNATESGPHRHFSTNELSSSSALWRSRATVVKEQVVVQRTSIKTVIMSGRSRQSQNQADYCSGGDGLIIQFPNHPIKVEPQTIDVRYNFGNLR